MLIPEIERAIAAIAADHEAGASALALQAIDVLAAAHRHGPAIVRASARALCRAQPAMAPIWQAAGLALGDAEPDALDRFREQVARAPVAIARFAVDLLELGVPDRPDRPLRITTCSASRAVLACLQSLAARRSVVVACAEGRPRHEGRGLATALASAGIAVELYTDAAVGVTLSKADAMLVGADAVAPDWFVNKVGTRQLAAAAAGTGVPVYVAAGRDKLLPVELASRLSGNEGPREEVWPNAPVGVTVRNPYFERIPVELVAACVTDQGCLGPAELADACASLAHRLPVQALLELLSPGMDDY